MRQDFPSHEGTRLPQQNSPVVILGSVDKRPRFAKALPFESRNQERTPWWLWWNVLSIDAPTVAVVWALVFARVAGSNVSTADVSILALTVWVIYISDRLLDGWSVQSGSLLHERHYFCTRHHRLLICLLIAATVAILWLTRTTLKAPELSAGFKLAGFVAAYMVGVHVGRSHFLRLFPKEVGVGFLFAAGAAWPAWSRARGFSLDICALFIFFALLCSLNCLAIECWENYSRRSTWRHASHPLVLWGNFHINHLSGALVVCALASSSVFGPWEASKAGWLALSLSALLILLLNVLRRKLSPEGLRVLADAALVIPGLLALSARI